MVRSHFNLDWSASLQRWLGDLVDQKFRRDRPLWPTLVSFDAEIYRCGEDARVFIIRDKPAAQAAPSVSSQDAVMAWPGELPDISDPFQSDILQPLIVAIYNHFKLRMQDYAIIIPDTDLNSIEEDTRSWTNEVSFAVKWQMNLAIERHYLYVHEHDEQPEQRSLDIEPYINVALIEELIDRNSKWHVGKLVAMLRELNSNYAAQQPYSCLMLCRAIMDHIPPIFESSKFSEIANNTSMSRTDKQYLAIISNNRFVSDDVLHRHIRMNADLIEMADLPIRASVNALLRLTLDQLT